jgi:hypothetical protein
MIRPPFSGQQPERMLSDPKPVLYREVRRKPTLAAAAIFRPARRRIQAAVDRRFNRRKYNSAQTIQAFSTRLRDQIDLDTLSTELLAVVNQTMEPTQVSLWLRPPPTGSPGTALSEARPATWVY